MRGHQTPAPHSRVSESVMIMYTSLGTKTKERTAVGGREVPLCDTPMIQRPLAQPSMEPPLAVTEHIVQHKAKISSSISGYASMRTVKTILRVK